MKAIQIQAFGQRRGLAPVPDLEMSSRAEELARSQFAQPRAIKVVYVQIPSKVESSRSGEPGRCGSNRAFFAPINRPSFWTWAGPNGAHFGPGSRRR